MSKYADQSTENLQSKSSFLPNENFSQQAIDLLKSGVAELATKMGPTVNENIKRVIDFTQDLQVEKILQGVCGNQARELTANNMDKLLSLASKLPDGKVETMKLGDVATIIAGGCLDPETAALIKNVQSIEKRGNHFEVVFNSPTSIKIGEKVPGSAGLVELSRIEMRQVSFDLSTKDGAQKLANLKGVDLKFEGPMGYDFDGEVKGVTMQRGPDGMRYQAQLSQKSVLAHVMGAPSEVTVNLKSDNSGHLVVTDADNIKREIRRSMIIGNVMPAVMPGGLGTLLGRAMK